MIPLLVYAGLCGLMYAKQRDLTYFPGFTRVDASQTDFELRRDDVVLRGWRFNPGRRHAVIYFGGNAESIQHMRGHLAAWVPDHSHYLLAYRGYGASEGRPEEDLLFADALALYDHVASEPGRETISVIGRSLGSGVASYVASQRPVHRLVLVTPFDSLAGVASHHYPWLPANRLIRDRYDSARHLADHRGPVMIVRAGRDQVIPADSTERLAAALGVAPTLLVLPTADHDSALADPADGGAVATFLTD
jgi:pimeloyl-ACP methyl ester carboxylesterase